MEGEQAPSSELSTTVDPSYVIHLIRKLLPVKNGDDDQVMDDAEADKESLKDGSAEEAGCVLWDLAANESISELMVDNFVIEVLHGILQVQLSSRMREICTGILGNLSYYKKPAKEIAGKQDLLTTIVEQLCLTDTQTLLETCRLLNVGLHSEEAEKWIETVASDDVLERLMWIAQNTLNDDLTERVFELLRTMVDSSKTTASVLLPFLMRLGIVELLKTTISSESSAITDGGFSTRDVVLDLALQVALEISLSDAFCSRLAEDEELTSLIFQVIRFSWKDDLAVSAVTAMVLLANLTAERPELVSQICQDDDLAERLLSLLPASREDSNARNALWSITRSICKRTLVVKECGCIRGLASQTSTLINDLKEDDVAAGGGKSSFELKQATMNDLANVFDEWLASHGNEDAAALRVLVKEAFELLKEL